MAEDMPNFDDWVGTSREQHDRIDAALLSGMSATLDRDDPPPRNGDPLPPCWHWMYFRDATRQSVLGLDGHPERGGLMPPVALPRRMWAGSKIRFRAPLRVGEIACKRSEIDSITPKSGNSGQLVFINIRHTYLNAADEVAIEEEQNIVYREAPKPGDTPPHPRPAPEQAPWRRDLEPDPVLLFRYSALIFNGHRIHYDRDYVTKDEGYPGLIVHGPLIATLLMDLCRREAHGRRLIRFDYRARGPIFDLGPFSVNGRPADGGAELWALDHQGRLAMTGDAQFETP